MRALFGLVCALGLVCGQEPTLLVADVPQSPYSALLSAFLNAVVCEDLDYPCRTVEVDAANVSLALAAGDVHVALDVNPVLVPDLPSSIVVEELGATVRGGWYVPSYIAASVPNWEALQSPNVSTGLLAGVAFAGPTGGLGQLSCGPDGLFAQLAVPLACTHAPWAAQHADLLAKAQANTPFLAFLTSPLPPFTYNLPAGVTLQRVAFPPTGGACFQARTCDYPPADLDKLVWGDLSTFFSPFVTAPVSEITLDAAALGAMMEALAGGATYTEASLAWAADHGGTVGAWFRRLRVDRLAPDHGPTSGQFIVQLWGVFGDTRPLTLTAMVGAAECLSTTWVNASLVECMAPPGFGQGVGVTVSEGFLEATSSAPFSYDAAVVRGLHLPDEPVSISDRFGLLLRSGQPLAVFGNNFAASSGLQCRFGAPRADNSNVVQATYVTESELSCLAPNTATGVQTMYVTNDFGGRWSAGVLIGGTPQCTAATDCPYTSAVMWPGTTAPGGPAPVDFGPASAPAAITVALAVDPAAADVYAWAAAAAVSKAANDPSLLRFTTTDVMVYTTEAIVSAATTAARDAAAVALYDRMVRTEGDLLTVVGDQTSVSSIALAHTMRSSNRPVVQLPVASTATPLSNPAEFPDLLRLVPSDVHQGRALALVVERFLPTLISGGFVNAITPGVAVIVSDDDYSQGVTASFLAAVPDTEFVVAYRVNVTQDSTVDSLFQQLLPLNGTSVRTFVALTATLDAVVDAARMVGALSQSNMWFGSDGLFSSPRLSELPASLCTAPRSESPLGANLTAQAAAAFPNSTYTAFVPVVYDMVTLFVHAMDAFVREEHSPSVVSYAARPDRLSALMREVFLGDASATGYESFTPKTNDPAVFSYGVLNTVGAETKVVGAVQQDGNVLLDDVSVVFPAGSSFQTSVPPVARIAMAVNTSDTLSLALVAAVSVALDTINADPTILPNTTLLLQLGAWDASTPISAAVAALAQEPDVHGVVGPLYSPEVVAVATAVPGVPLVSPVASLSSLASPTQWPFFLRMVGGDPHQAEALLSVVLDYQWSRVILVSFGDEPYSADIAATFMKLAEKVDNFGTVQVVLSTTMSDAGIASEMSRARGTGVRVIMLLSLVDYACQVLTHAFAAGLMEPGYAWVGSDAWLTPPLDSCSEAVGTIGLLPTLGMPGALLNEFESEWSRRVAAPITSQYIDGDPAAIAALDALRSTSPEATVSWIATRAHDTTMLYAKAFDALIGQRQRFRASEVMRYLRSQVFNGLVGLVRFEVSSNDLAEPAFDVVNVLSPTELGTVGGFTGPALVNFTGCPPGQFLLQTTCALCGADTYKEGFGDDSCTPCPSGNGLRMTTDGEVGASSLLQCLCPLTMYTDPEDVTEFPCKPCPLGGVCAEVGLKLEAMPNAAGFWRGNPLSPVFDVCIVPGRCSLSGPPTPVALPVEHSFTHSTPCPKGYTGPVCNVCDVGFGKDLSRNCVRCTSQTTSSVLVTLAVLFAVAAVGILVWMELSSKAYELSERRRSNNLKVMVSYFQFSSFLGYFGVQWTSSMRRLLGMQQSVSSSAFAALSWDCVFANKRLASTYYVFWLYMVVPLGSLLLAVMATFVLRRLPRWRCRRCRRFDSEYWSDVVVAVLVATLFLIYPLLLGGIVSSLDCQDFRGLEATATEHGMEGTLSSLLRIDPRIDCLSSTYQTYRAFAWTFVVLYIVGIPAALGIVLYVERNSLLVASTGGGSTSVILLNAPDIETLARSLRGKDREAPHVYGVGAPTPVKKPRDPLAELGTSLSPPHGRGRSDSLSRMTSKALRRVSVTEIFRMIPAAEQRRRVRQNIKAAREFFDIAYEEALAVEAAQQRRGPSDAPHKAAARRVMQRRSEMVQALFLQTVEYVQTDGRNFVMAMADSLDQFNRVLRNQRRYGFVYLGYKPDKTYFEVVSMFRKAAMVVSIIMLSGYPWQTQLAAGVIVTAISLLIASTLDPYLIQSVFDTTIMYLNKKNRFLLKMQRLRRLRHDINDPKASETKVLPSLAKYPFYVRLPEIVHTALLERISLLVVLFNISLCYISDQTSVSASTEVAQPLVSAQFLMLFLHSSMTTLFIVVLLCDTWTYLKLQMANMTRDPLYYCRRKRTTSTSTTEALLTPSPTPSRASSGDRGSRVDGLRRWGGQSSPKMPTAGAGVAVEMTPTSWRPNPVAADTLPVTPEQSPVVTYAPPPTLDPQQSAMFALTSDLDVVDTPGLVVPPQRTHRLQIPQQEAKSPPHPLRPQPPTVPPPAPRQSPPGI